MEGKSLSLDEALGAMADYAFPQIDGQNDPVCVLDPFDPLGFTDDFLSDLVNAPGGVLSDLNFDGDVDFSIEDLLSFPDLDADIPSDHSGTDVVGGSDPVVTSAAGFDVKEGSGSGSGSGVSSSSSLNSGNSVSVTDFLDCVNYAACSPDSGISTSLVVGGGGEVKVEEKLEDRKGAGLKRKKEKRDGEEKCETNNPSGNSYVRSSKVRRSSGTLEEESSPCLSNGENENDEKRKARLIRNRESAQLSRQRKKHYVEELEEKVKSMQAMITDLNGKISYFMAENVSLRQQLGGNGGNGPPPPGVYPPIHPIAPIHYPWIPGYAVRPQGSQVPLIPIPKLKPQQHVSTSKLKKSDHPSSTTKSKKSDCKKAEIKTKKVASVSLLGLLFFMFFVGGFVPGVDFRNGGYRNFISDGYGSSKSRMLGQSHNRVLSVKSDFNEFKKTEKSGLCGGDIGCGSSALGSLHRSNSGTLLERNAKQKEVSSHPSSSTIGKSSGLENASEPLLASLYVPRNDKLVKIDGNLIISSVLASEKAMAHTSSESKRHEKITLAGNGDRETSLAIAKSLAYALAVPELATDSGRHSNSHTYRTINKYQKALPPSFTETRNDNGKSTPADGPLKEWFREGLEGPVFSSGMCTEVFQFDVAPASGSSGGIIPSTLVNGSTDKNSSRPTNINRRILRSQPIPLNNSTTINTTGEGFARPRENRSYQSTKPAKTTVVSVLVDPREAGDGGGMMQPKSISRIFVVVLVDSVKYITYSCVLPFRNNSPHLVTN